MILKLMCKYRYFNYIILSFSIEFHRLSTVKYATGKSASIFTDSDLESKIIQFKIFNSQSFAKREDIRKKGSLWINFRHCSHSIPKSRRRSEHLYAREGDGGNSCVLQSGADRERDKDRKIRNREEQRKPHLLGLRQRA